VVDAIVGTGLAALVLFVYHWRILGLPTAEVPSLAAPSHRNY
jgi:hypothetical protein